MCYVFIRIPSFFFFGNKSCHKNMLIWQLKAFIWICNAPHCDPQSRMKSWTDRVIIQTQTIKVRGGSQRRRKGEGDKEEEKQQRGRAWGLIPPGQSASPQRAERGRRGKGKKRMTYEDTPLERDVSTLWWHRAREYKCKKEDNTV